MRLLPLPAGVIAVALLCAAGPRTARADQPSAASLASVRASAAVIDGSAALIGAGSELTLAAVDVAGDSVTLVLKGAAGSVSVTLSVAAATVELLASSVGAVVETVAVRAGHLLVISGESIAFVAGSEARRHRHHRPWP